MFGGVRGSGITVCGTVGRMAPGGKGSKEPLRRGRSRARHRGQAVPPKGAVRNPWREWGGVAWGPPKPRWVGTGERTANQDSAACPEPCLWCLKDRCFCGRKLQPGIYSGVHSPAEPVGRQHTWVHPQVEGRRKELIDRGELGRGSRQPRQNAGTRVQGTGAGGGGLPHSLCTACPQHRPIPPGTGTAGNTYEGSPVGTCWQAARGWRARRWTGCALQGAQG